jgi:hypothetical protein
MAAFVFVADFSEGREIFRQQSGGEESFAPFQERTESSPFHCVTLNDCGRVAQLVEQCPFKAI